MQDLKSGDTLITTSKIGDFYNGKSVVIPKGTQAHFVDYYDRKDPHPHPTRKMARFFLPTSPGKKILECDPNEIDLFYKRAPDNTTQTKLGHFKLAQLKVGDKFILYDDKQGVISGKPSSTYSYSHIATVLQHNTSHTVIGWSSHNPKHPAHPTIDEAKNRFSLIASDQYADCDRADTVSPDWMVYVAERATSPNPSSDLPKEETMPPTPSNDSPFHFISHPWGLRCLNCGKVYEYHYYHGNPDNQELACTKPYRYNDVKDTNLFFKAPLIKSKMDELKVGDEFVIYEAAGGTISVSNEGICADTFKTPIVAVVLDEPSSQGYIAIGWKSSVYNNPYYAINDHLYSLGKPVPKTIYSEQCNRVVPYYPKGVLVKKVIKNTPQKTEEKVVQPEQHEITCECNEKKWYSGDAQHHIEQGTKCLYCGNTQKVKCPPGCVGETKEAMPHIECKMDDLKVGDKFIVYEKNYVSTNEDGEYKTPLVATVLHRDATHISAGWLGLNLHNPYQDIESDTFYHSDYDKLPQSEARSKCNRWATWSGTNLLVKKVVEPQPLQDPTAKIKPGEEDHNAPNRELHIAKCDCGLRYSGDNKHHMTSKDFGKCEDCGEEYDIWCPAGCVGETKAALYIQLTNLSKLAVNDQFLVFENKDGLISFSQDDIFTTERTATVIGKAPEDQMSERASFAAREDIGIAWASDKPSPSNYWSIPSAMGIMKDRGWERTTKSDIGDRSMRLSGSHLFSVKKILGASELPKEDTKAQTKEPNTSLPIWASVGMLVVPASDREKANMAGRVHYGRVQSIDNDAIYIQYFNDGKFYGSRRLGFTSRGVDWDDSSWNIKPQSVPKPEEQSVEAIKDHIASSLHEGFKSFAGQPNEEIKVIPPITLGQCKVGDRVNVHIAGNGSFLSDNISEPTTTATILAKYDNNVMLGWETQPSCPRATNEAKLMTVPLYAEKASMDIIKSHPWLWRDGVDRVCELVMSPVPLRCDYDGTHIGDQVEIGVSCYGYPDSINSHTPLAGRMTATVLGFANGCEAYGFGSYVLLGWKENEPWAFPGQPEPTEEMIPPHTTLNTIALYPKRKWVKADILVNNLTLNERQVKDRALKEIVQKLNNCPIKPLSQTEDEQDKIIIDSLGSLPPHKEEPAPKETSGIGTTLAMAVGAIAGGLLGAIGNASSNIPAVRIEETNSELIETPTDQWALDKSLAND